VIVKIVYFLILIVYFLESKERRGSEDSLEPKRRKELGGDTERIKHSTKS